MVWDYWVWHVYPQLWSFVIHSKEIELREVRYVGDEIQAELQRRFNEIDVKKQLPHYYVCGTGSNSVCIRAFVALKTVKEIQKQLRKK